MEGEELPAELDVSTSAIPMPVTRPQWQSQSQGKGGGGGICTRIASELLFIGLNPCRRLPKLRCQVLKKIPTPLESINPVLSFAPG